MLHIPLVLIIVIFVRGRVIQIVHMIGVSGASVLVMVHMSVTIVRLAKSGVIPRVMFGVVIATCGVIPFIRISVMIAVVSKGFVGVNVHGCKFMIGKWRMCPMRWLIVLSLYPLHF